MSTRKIDGRKAEITNKMKEYKAYKAFAVRHGYPDAAVNFRGIDTRTKIQNGDIVTLLVSGDHEDFANTLWIVEAANGERHIIGEDGLRILDEDSAPITVLPDESLGGVLREYREVKRTANVGERIKFTGFDRGFNMDGVEILLKVGEVLTVADRYDHRPNPENAVGVCVTGRPNIRDNEYVVLEPTDVLRIDGGRFRMVDRKAAVGERVIITNPEEDSDVFGDYSIGETYVISRVDEYTSGEDVYIASPDVYLHKREYAVLEPVGGDESASAPLSTRPATEQIAENIASLAAKVQALEDDVKRMDTQLRVAREDIELIEEGVAGDIERLEKRVKALEPGFSREKADATGRAIKRTLESIKSTQQIRDEIVERAKADVKALSVSMVRNVPVLHGGTAVFNLKHGDNAPTFPDIVKFKVDRGKRTVVALIYTSTGTLWARGIAKCAPNAVFNAHIGRAIALRRALGLEVPTEYLNAPNPTEIRVGDVVDYGGRIATVALDGRSIDTRTHTFISTAVGCDATIIDDSRDDEAEFAKKGAAA